MVVVRQVSAPVTRSEVSSYAPGPPLLTRMMTPRAMTPMRPTAPQLRVPAVRVDSPLSARPSEPQVSPWQRKQALYQSSHFEVGKVYASSQKPAGAAYENVKQKIPCRRPQVEAGHKLSPKDMRVAMNADHRVVLQPMESELGSDRSHMQCASTAPSQPDARAAGNFNVVRVRRLTPGRPGDEWHRSPKKHDSVTLSPGTENVQASNVCAEVLLSSERPIKSEATSKYGARFSRVDSSSTRLSNVDGCGNDFCRVDSGCNGLAPSPPNLWADGLRNGQTGWTHCVVPDNKPLQVVPAAPDDGAIPWEFRALSTNLKWNDSRSELESPRRCAGGSRNQSRQAKRRSQSLQERRCGGFSLAALDTTEFPQFSTSPSERKLQNLEASVRNPLQPRSTDTDVNSAPSTPRLKRSPRYKPGVSPESPRRRIDRNYSDLFGRETPECSGQRSPRSPRSKFEDLAGCNFLDTRAEVSRSARGPRDEDRGRARTSPRWNRKRNASDIFDCSTPDVPKENFNMEEERLWANSRACWDTRIAWDMNAEIERRLRERMLEKSSSSLQAPRPDSQEPTSRSGSCARRHKRLDMASGNMRHGIGSTPALWDDGRDGPGPDATTQPTMRMRSYPDSPAFKRSASWNSARSRYFESVLTSSIL